MQLRFPYLNLKTSLTCLNKDQNKNNTFSVKGATRLYFSCILQNHKSILNVLFSCCDCLFLSYYL